MADLKKWFPFRFQRKLTGKNEVMAPNPSMMPMHSIREEMDRMFERLWTDPFAALESRARWFGDFSQPDFLPKLDVIDDKNFLRIDLEVPGVDSKDINVEVEDGAMTISGEKKHEEVTEEQGCYRTERSYGYFKRTIPLPTEIDTDMVEAKFDKGILKIKVPKTEKAKKHGKKVPVHA